MRQLNVDLGERAYPISIGKGLLSDSALFEPYVANKQVMVVSNETIFPLYGELLLKALSSAKASDVAILPDGEAFKNLDTLNNIFTALLEKRHNRNTVLVALGGGVVGDMAGFAAAAYQRGVKFVQVPTTLLSQVDSSVGGKTGVNHPLGKNMIGAFHQPVSVVIDTQVLSTLPEREISAGLAEIIKYGFIADAGFFAFLEDNIECLRNLDEDKISYAIERSCQIKAEVVAADEREGGRRAILNLGHTFGHAIEAHLGYGSWLHGEAVGLGMAMACDLSVRMNLIDASILERGRVLIDKANLPLRVPQGMTAEDFMRYMRVDKKVLNGQLRLVLLDDLGSALVTEEATETLINQTIRAFS